MAVITSDCAPLQGMVFPGDELVTQLSHTGMTGGRKVVSVMMMNAKGEPVLTGEKARASLLQPSPKPTN